MKIRRIFFLACLAAASLRAENEIGFIEKFALAPDRAAVLAQLTPGTEDWYFFRALHFQNTRQTANLKDAMAQWAKRFPESERRKIIENREALLTYDATPQATLKFLRDRLGVEFTHERETQEAPPDLPAALDAKLIARGVFQEQALEDDDLEKCGEDALEMLVRAKTPLRPEQVRALLGKLTRPDVAGLVDLIAKDLKTDESGGFGEFEIHKLLLPEQLDDLAKRLPDLKESEAWVAARLAKLAPDADVNPAAFPSHPIQTNEDSEAPAESRTGAPPVKVPTGAPPVEPRTLPPAEREAWLDRAWAFVKTLPSSFNSLKAHILHQRLMHDRARGIHDRARFLEYLKLPRQAAYMNAQFLERAAAGGHEADLDADMSGMLPGCAPIGDDEELVREYLLHFFIAEEKWEPWTQWLRDTFVKPLFAEAKIVNGIGDAEKWAPLLSPGEFQALRDRVDLDFAPANPELLAPGDVVNLDLFIKNAPQVIVKIYEINTLSFFLTQKRQLNTDIALDGLIANREMTQSFDDPPLRRVARTFKFPELKGRRGAWVIEFIGGGKSSRALIRKGEWHLLQQGGPAGDMLTVLDENYAPVPDAVAWFEGRRFSSAGTPPVERPAGAPPADPAPAGEAPAGPMAGGAPALLLPFTQKPGTKPIVLASADGTFATLAQFEHHAENYQLDAQFHIAREQLLAGREATVAVRATLLLNDAPVAPSLLLDAKLKITATTLDGIATTTEVKDLKLDPLQEFTHTFSVPDRLADLEVELTAEVESLSSGGEKEELDATGEWHVNGIDKTDAVMDGHLAQFGGGYVFELLGKNGEPLPNRAVDFTFTHRDFTGEAEVSLRTDAKGRVSLGPLGGIKSLAAQAGDGDSRTWELKNADRTWPGELHAAAGEVVRVPWLDEALLRPVENVSLLEVRAGTFAKSVRGAVAFKDGFLEIAGLAPGDYLLRVHGWDGKIKIKITRGVAAGGWLLSPARELEVRDAAPLHIASIATGADALVVRLKNANEFTRVHVVAERFLNGQSLFDQLGGFTRAESASAIPARHPNLFAAGREIGDEFRYILERRYAQKFPGNMLARPGLVLNPWEKRSTETAAQTQAAGEASQKMDGDREAEENPPLGEFKSVEGGDSDTAAANLDFLANAAPVLHNLLPDKDGVVRIDRKLLGDRQHVEILATDLEHAVWRTVALPETAVKFRDLRLTRNLDLKEAFVQKSEVTVLTAGQTLTLADAGTAEWQTYDSLASIHALFVTLAESRAGAPPVESPAGASPADPMLSEFSWLLKWPALKDEEKRAKVSEFACHELNFFLSRKDPAFFTAVVQPHLRNKKDKTFMDDYLIGADVQRYLEPWAYARLNVVERALLAQRLPDESPAAARHLRELWELLPPDPARDDRLFETALHGHALENESAEGEIARRVPQEKPVAEFDAPQIPQDFGGVAATAANPVTPTTSIEGALQPTAPADGIRKKMGKAVAGADAADARMNGDDVTKLAAGNRSGKAAISANAIDSLLFGDMKKMMASANASDTTYPVSGKTKGLKPAIAGIAGILTDPKFTVVIRALNAKRLRDDMRPFYRKLGAVKEWAENNYYELPIEDQDASLITINAFWRDYAAWDGKTPFLSAHVAEASRNFSEMMLALAVLDLPFEPGKHATKNENGAFTITAASPMIVFHKRIEPAQPAPDDAGLLVSQNFFRADDAENADGNEKSPKYVTGEFLSGVVYGADVVVTNPTSAKQRLSLLLQIPRGALPVSGSKATDSRRIELAPFTTQKAGYFFYFPAPAAEPLPHYAVHVSRSGIAAGSAPAVTFKVVKQLTEADKTSWEWVSQDGSEAEVFAHLETHNLARTDLARIAWRARKSAAFFGKLIALLERRHIYDDTIYSYAVVHNDRAALREWLRHRDDFLAQCGPFLDSRLLAIDPVERRAYEHLEYSPLVNQRAHRLGAEPKIANPVFREQYRRLLQILAHKPAPDAADQLSVVYYLFLQDRIGEALARLHAIKPEAVTAKLQFDYLRCYAAFYEDQTAAARGLAAEYSDYPVDRWRQLFAEVRAKLDEAEGRSSAGAPPAMGRAGEAPAGLMTAGAAALLDPALDFKIENKTIALTWKNLREVTINYYVMDPEFLFSGSPFASADAGRFAITKPAQTATHTLPEGKDTLDIPVPVEFAKSNVLVEILGAGQRKAQPYHANTFKLTVAENYGRLELRDLDGKAVSRAYVKVYARLKDGTVRFFKDGYTDLRGRFDYASLNGRDAAVAATARPSSDPHLSPPPPRSPSQEVPAASPPRSGDAPAQPQPLRPDELPQIAKLAILVLSETHGAAIREVNPPKE